MRLLGLRREQRDKDVLELLELFLGAGVEEGEGGQIDCFCGILGVRYGDGLSLDFRVHCRRRGGARTMIRAVLDGHSAEKVDSVVEIRLNLLLLHSPPALLGGLVLQGVSVGVVLGFFGCALGLLLGNALRLGFFGGGGGVGGFLGLFFFGALIFGVVAGIPGL